MRRLTLSRFILIMFGVGLFFVYEFTAQKNERQIKFNTSLLNALDEVIWVKDTNDILLFVSDKYCKYVFNDTIKPIELIGVSAEKFFGKETNERFKRNDEYVLKHDTSVTFLEYSIVNNDTIYYYVQKTALKNDKGINFATVGKGLD